jgi:hypothetical protein
MLILVGTSLGDLMASIGSKRYAPPLFDANRVGFFAVTAIPAQLWFVARGRLHKAALIATGVCVFAMVGASSRGSVGALLIGGTAVAILYSVKEFRSSSFRIRKSRLSLVLLLLCLLPFVIAAEEPAFERVGDYLRTKLELDTRDRGLNSGFTGRATNWSALLGTLPKTSWLFGNGFRTSELDFTFAVDNGYLSGIYELGLFSTLIVMAKYASVFGFLSAAYVTRRSSSDFCLLAFAFTLAIFLTNAFVHRVLFGPGDPASLLALFMFVSARDDFFPEKQPTPNLVESSSGHRR